MTQLREVDSPRLYLDASFGPGRMDGDGIRPPLDDTSGRTEVALDIQFPLKAAHRSWVYPVKNKAPGNSIVYEDKNKGKNGDKGKNTPELRQIIIEHYDRIFFQWTQGLLFNLSRLFSEYPTSGPILGSYFANVGGNRANPRAHKLEWGLTWGLRQNLLQYTFAEAKMGVGLSRPSLTSDQGTPLWNDFSTLVKGQARLGIEYCVASSTCVAPSATAYYVRTGSGGPPYQEYGLLFGVSFSFPLLGPEPRIYTSARTVFVPVTQTIHHYDSSVKPRIMPPPSSPPPPEPNTRKDPAIPLEKPKPGLPHAVFYFGPNRSEIQFKLGCLGKENQADEGGVVMLDDMGEFLNNNPTVTIRLHGHVPQIKDDVDDIEDHSKQKARDRSLENAFVVRQYLEQCHSIKKKRMEIEGIQGEPMNPAAPYDSGHGFKKPRHRDLSHWQNDRVEFEVIEP